MTWVVWRLHRNETFITLGVMAMIAAVLLITGLQMAHTFQQSGLSACVAHSRGSVLSACGPLGTAFMNQYGSILPFVGFALPALPVVFGTLVGAPLVARELEQRTHLLVWMQSVTRLRWLTVTLVLVLAASLLIAALVLPLLAWWYGPFAHLEGSFRPPAFDFSGPVLPAATLLALTCGIAAGAVTRRTVAAIFVTLVLFLAIRAPVELLLRPNFEPQITVTWPLARGNHSPITLNPQDWQVDDGWIDNHGQRANGFRCTSATQVERCFRAAHFRANFLSYQPANRFWTFQWIETGIYLGFSALAVALTYITVQRRLG